MRRTPPVTSRSRHASMVSFCMVLTLVPLVCNAGVLSPGHATDMQTPGAAADVGAAHSGGHAEVAHGDAAGRYFAPRLPHCGPHHGHACCLLAARKPLREDALDAVAGVVAQAPPASDMRPAVAGRGAFPPPPEPLGASSPATINAPLLR